MKRNLARSAFPMALAMAALLLHSCADRDLPGFVQEMVDADFPADGLVHIQTRGTIMVEPATAFCTFRPGWGLDNELVNARLRQMGQSEDFNGGSRMSGRAGVSPQCTRGRSVFVNAVPTDNRQGRPYKMVLAVWQGEAACVATIERPDGRRPGVRAPQGSLFHRVSPEEWQQASLPGDMADLSRVCVARLTRAIS